MPIAPVTAGTPMRATVPRAPWPFCDELPFEDRVDCSDPPWVAPLLWLWALAPWPLELLRRFVLCRLDRLEPLDAREPVPRGLALRALPLRALAARELPLRELALRPELLRPLLEACARVLPLPDPLALRPEPLRLALLRVEPLLRLALLRVEPLLPLLRVEPLLLRLPLLRLPLLDPLALWLRVRPRLVA